MLVFSMIKKTIFYTLLFFTLLIIPVAVKAQGPTNAPFLLKDGLGEIIGTIDLEPLWEKINLLIAAVDINTATIANIEIGPSTSQTIKVYDANGQYIGLFNGLDSKNYVIFLEEQGKLISFNPNTLSFPENQKEYYSDSSCLTGANYVDSTTFDSNIIYLFKDSINDNIYAYPSEVKDQEITDQIYEDNIMDNRCDPLQDTSNLVPLVILDNDPLPDNLLAPLKLVL